MATKTFKDDIRSGNFGDLGITGGKRLSDRFDMTASLVFSKAKGKEGPQIVPTISSDVFDQDHWTASLQGNFLITNRLLLLAAIKYFDVDFISACTKSNVGTVLAKEKGEAICNISTSIHREFNHRQKTRIRHVSHSTGALPTS